MTLAALAIGFARLTLALRTALAPDRVDIAQLREPHERFAILIFARRWNETLRSQCRKTVFS